MQSLFENLEPQARATAVDCAMPAGEAALLSLAISMRRLADTVEAATDRYTYPSAIRTKNVT